MESVTVGSIVTMAVITAKTGGQFNNSQIQAVKKMATAVLIIRLPGNKISFIRTPSESCGIQYIFTIFWDQCKLMMNYVGHENLGSARSCCKSQFTRFSTD